MKTVRFLSFLSASSFFSVASLFLFLGAVSQADEPNVPQTVKTNDGRELKLVWNDEFNGEGLPDPSKWSYEIGYVRNNEAQYYTDARLENVCQKDGNLVITTLKEKYSLEGKKNTKGRAEAEYTSGAIETLGKASWLYGRVEVRAKLPKGKGIWPAIWMMGDNIGKVGYPKCGEIDVMEYVGHTPKRSHATIHMQNKDNLRGVVSKGKNLFFENLEEEFHVFALEWTEEQLTILVDERVALEFKRAEEAPKTPEWPFDKPCYIILNTALGGSWGGAIAEDTCPAEFLIDYVRVYQ